ncbi:uncharacterized protein LOC116714162 isoform X1 [Xiphophorus hellerii]|uniref:uncharacterized protein LOC116714162 isoform X1 n=1 Tax=Xiphophorus hellerii TaxID=8084 RepID=UPI0013B3B0B5|nr:uncharacterized protein LOC116714162 isoform X1 [Xiphophorus hellerii]
MACSRPASALHTGTGIQSAYGGLPPSSQTLSDKHTHVLPLFLSRPLPSPPLSHPSLLTSRPFLPPFLPATENRPPSHMQKKKKRRNVKSLGSAAFMGTGRRESEGDACLMVLLQIRSAPAVAEPTTSQTQSYHTARPLKPSTQPAAAAQEACRRGLNVGDKQESMSCRAERMPQTLQRRPSPRCRRRRILRTEPFGDEDEERSRIYVICQRISLWNVLSLFFHFLVHAVRRKCKNVTNIQYIYI